MSEYQYVAFRAIDRAVNEVNLRFMRQQSTRAMVTSQSFENEYGYGNFRGDAIEMLRRGYDVHLHYTDFGIRTLMIRFPHGLPDPPAVQSYIVDGSLEFVKDKTGPGGSLCIEPIYEPDYFSERIWGLGPLFERLVPMRAELLGGDLRPLYLAHLAVARDSDHDPEETREGPVPAGLDQLTDAQCVLADFYGLSDELIAAAAKKCPLLPDCGTPFLEACLETPYEKWIHRQKRATTDAWLAALMNDPDSLVREEIQAKYQADLGLLSWPTSPPSRTVAQLETAATRIRRRTAAKTARERARRLAKMVTAPDTTLREIRRLVVQQRRDAYRQAAVLLADLREALAGSEQSDFAEKQAQKFKAKNPQMTRELRRHGFLSK